jgi:hypothetical protein
VRLFFDNTVSRAVVQALALLAQAQGVEVRHLLDRFAASTPDLEWISKLREEGDWVIVSGDTRISRSVAERAAWHESGLTAFFLGDGFSSRKFWVQAGELVKWCPIIVDTAKRCTTGSGFLLPFKGSEPKLIYEPEANR